MKKLTCFLFGHVDPVFFGVGFESNETMYEKWRTWERNCYRCDKALNV